MQIVGFPMRQLMFKECVKGMLSAILMDAFNCDMESWSLLIYKLELLTTELLGPVRVILSNVTSHLIYIKV